MLINTKQRKILITAALPYANGDLHLGHLTEHIQCDIWKRFNLLIGNTCLFICGDDAHGTPIMLKSKKLNIKELDLIKHYYIQHTKNFYSFNILHDIYYTTHSLENKLFVTYFFNKTNEINKFFKRSIKQPFDEKVKIYLPDRYVVGLCKNCNCSNTTSDSCTNCGFFNTMTDLKNPISILTKTTITYKKTNHIFIKLNTFKLRLEIWINFILNSQKIVKNKLVEWFYSALKNWDITRNYPYFGYKIPHSNKYFYVWWDAPIGYISIFEKFCKLNKKNKFLNCWNPTKFSYDIYHFIGKDITYFHTIFWPSMLVGTFFRLPTGVFSHGFLNINNIKMSKSKNYQININTYLENLQPEYLRFYLSLKLNDGINDINFELDDFIKTINVIFINKILNIVSRCFNIINKEFNNVISSFIINKNLHKIFIKKKYIIFKSFYYRNYSNVIEIIIHLTNLLNKYLTKKKPWTLLTNIKYKNKAHDYVSTSLNLFKIIMFYLKSIIPETTQKLEILYNIPNLTSKNFDSILLNHKILNYVIPLHKITAEDVNVFYNIKKYND